MDPAAADQTLGPIAAPGPEACGCRSDGQVRAAGAHAITGAPNGLRAGAGSSRCPTRCPPGFACRKRRRRRTGGWSDPGLGAQRGEAPPAVRAVVDVLRGELLERAAAQPEVLDRPGEVARGWGERQDLAHDLELLAGLPVDVDRPGLDLEDELAVRSRPQPVSLLLTHGGRNISAAAVSAGGVRPRLDHHVPCAS